MILIPGTALSVPGSFIDQRPTSAKEAWLNGAYLTVRLHGPLRALRVHVAAGAGAATAENVHLVSGAGLQGRWYAIGDFVQPYDEYIASRSLPQTRTAFGRRSLFTHAALVTFPHGAVLNIGRAGPLFGHGGGGEQAEFVDGPTPTVKPLRGAWGREYGHA